jgi:hypothetical protein
MALMKKTIFFNETEFVYFESMIKIDKFPHRPEITRHVIMENGYEISSELLSEDSNLSTVSLKRKDGGEGKVVFVDFVD